MAQRTRVELIDDLDGSAADITVSFSFAGKSYEIDLTNANAGKLEKALEKYITAARRVDARRPGTRRPRGAGSSGPNPREIREWARANGHEVSERGRVSEEVRAAYLAAN